MTDKVTWDDIDMIQAQQELQQARVWKREPIGSMAVKLLEADAALLEKVGLPADVALNSARAVHGGIYGSLEEAATAAYTWGRTRRLNQPLLERLVRERGGSRLIEERKAPSASRLRVLESGRATASGDGRLAVVLISAGQGSSGYYPARTLQEAARAKVFHRGLHTYVDHPTASEVFDRPERSVRDLAGQLATDATYRDGALHAEVTVFQSHRALITERASAIGLSIRAEAEVTESLSGPVVERITRAESVDYVTHAGRGGRILI